MKLSITLSITIQVVLLGVAYLVPAFVPMTSSQQAAISAFVGAVQLILSGRAYYLSPEGQVSNPPLKPQDPPKAP